MDGFGHFALGIAKSIENDLSKSGRPPDEGKSSATEQVLPFSIVSGTRGYIENVVNQINGCYENGWFDACAVMMRRLVETLIIEAFEHNKIDAKIKNTNGDFFYLKDLIDKTLAETAWNLSRNTKRALPQLKGLGDLSAHNRRYLAHLGDIDKVKDALRVSTQELIYLAGLK